MENYINYIYGALGLVIGAIVPFIVRKVKIYLAYIESKTGENFYNQAKVFIESLAKLHPEDFAEEKITDLLDKLDNKYGDHLSRNQIKEIVDFVGTTIVTDVVKEVAK
ncbi:hypothetical protein [Clostridium felsineum]|uniref:Uncharacterized protein n=1 Tax=Clostridium felsineum TaxID=36839 RepID=A0A1S8M2G8_9CLOT|nr:hypothetical protein [Clostridium felsineum]URZ06761.1 hypothetical protein CLROS_020940 [Clostridium felsineum]URZ11793.1 hypothetical protein CROST_025100 [Clostridium felsineum]